MEIVKNDIERLREYAMNRWKLGEYSLHGVEHWDRVAKNGDTLNVSGADMVVVRVFAYLHDVERLDDGYDMEHGPRAAKLISQIRGTVLNFLNDQQIELLTKACSLHTVVRKTGNATIDTCFDADRLDLPRVGIMPRCERMATKEGAEKAKELILKMNLSWQNKR